MAIFKTSTITKPSNQPPPTVHTGSCDVRGNRLRGSDNTSGKCCARLGYVFGGLVLLGFACSGLILYRQYGLGGFNLHTYHDGDQVLVDDTTSDLNSILCQAYAVSSNDRTNVYLTNGKAKITPDVKEVFSLRNSGLKAELQFDYRAFYLLPGSSIKVAACMSILNKDPHVQAEVLFIKGDKHFDRWRVNADCHHCVQHRVLIPHDALCESGQGVIAEHVVSHKDTYYVVITRQQRSDDHQAFSAETYMQVTKTLYDVSDAKAMCLNTLHCKLNLTYASDDDVIVEFTFPRYSYPGSSTYFTTACELRRTFWIAVFGLVPTGLVGLFIVLACLCGCMKGDAKQKVLKKQAASRMVFAIPHSNPERPRVPPV